MKCQVTSQTTLTLDGGQDGPDRTWRIIDAVGRTASMRMRYRTRPGLRGSIRSTQPQVQAGPVWPFFRDYIESAGRLAGRKLFH